MPKAIISPLARQDLLDIWEVIAADKIDAADRVREAAFRSFERLAGMPDIGTIRRYNNPALADLRFWPIPRFRRYLIFYLPAPGGVEIVRVLHGARDMTTIFGV